VQHWEKRLVALAISLRPELGNTRTGARRATGSALGNWRSLGPALGAALGTVLGPTQWHTGLRWRVHPGPLGLVLGPALSDC
jgi:hypothetical protein